MPPVTSARHLIVAAPGEKALTPEQRRFNQLLAKLDKARADLQRWVEQAQLFAEGHAARVTPLRRQLVLCLAEMTRRLDALLGRRDLKWPKSERRRLRNDISAFCAGVLDECEDEALETEMKALFERHAGHDIETENRESMAAMKELFETMSGVDLGDREFADEEDLMRAAHQRVTQEAEAQQERRAARKKPSAAQARREREEQEASQSLREVYRKLAAAIHPDRADDEADRERRHALMQRANQANDRKDLLALLALQLEIEQVDPSAMASLTAARARQYSRLLSDQLREIEAEIHARRIRLCMDFGLNPMPPPRVDHLGALLERLVDEQRAYLAQAESDLVFTMDPVRARRWLRQRWHDEDRDCPF